MADIALHVPAGLSNRDKSVLVVAVISVSGCGDHVCCVCCVMSGGPLCDGDIEEANGVLQVFCPWHDYDFNLRTGKSGTGLQVGPLGVLNWGTCWTVLG